MEEDILTIISRVKQDDESAFAELCEKYKALTESAAHRFLPSFREDGGEGEYGLDDLRQYAAVALFRAAKTYEPHTDGKGKAVSFGLYAKICVNNALISVLRKHRSAVKKSLKSVDDSGKKNAQPDLSDRLVLAESASEMKKKIRAVLSGYETEIFDYYISGKSVGEIAEETGRQEKSVSNALYRVKAKIKGLLTNQ